MLHEALRFLVQKPVEAVELLVLRQRRRFDAVNKLEVEVIDTGLLQLLVEYLVTTFKESKNSGCSLSAKAKAVRG